MTARPRILEICAYPPPFAGWAVRVWHVRKHLESAGCECVVLNLGEHRRVPSVEYETVDGAWDYARKVWGFARRGYLLHTHVNGESTKGLLMAWFAECVAAVAGRGSVLTFHAGAAQQYFPRRRAGWRAPVFSSVFRLPKAVICNSADVRARIAEYGVPESRIHPIPAFSPQYLQFERCALPDAVEALLARCPRVIVSYAEFRATYSIDELLEALDVVIASRSDVGAVLCGLSSHSDARVVSNTAAAVERLRATGRVVMPGNLSHDAFLSLIARSAAYVRVPLTDGVASSVLEALALGVPVIASDNGTRPSGVALYEAGSAGALARACLGQLDGGAGTGAPRAASRDTVAEEGVLLARCAAI